MSIAGRKVYTPLDKNANLAFINMESGGAAPPNKPAAPAPIPITVKPVPAQPVNQKPSTIISPKPLVPQTPQNPTPAPLKPAAPPAKPVSIPTPITPKPVNPAPVNNPITTPGPGSVKQLINFYDSQGKASPIRPYSYSQAVKQGKST